MNYNVYVILVITKWLCVTIANPNINKGDRIMGGYDAEPYKQPYMISLQIRFLYIRTHICGGALLNEYFVLSAAHCATESWLIRWLPMDAVAGAYDVNKFQSETQIKSILHQIPHPLYNGGVGPHDIGLYKTVTPFIFTKIVQPIKLATNYQSSNGDLKLYGWGVLKTTLFIPVLPNKLQELDVTYLPFEECYKSIDNFLELNEENPLDKDANICTGPTIGGFAACEGDSGGPLVQSPFPPPNDPVEDSTEKYDVNDYNCTDNYISSDNKLNYNNNNVNYKYNNKNEPQLETMEPLLIGIVSWGASPCGDKGAPTVYTNVSSYIDFINYNINDW